MIYYLLAVLISTVIGRTATSKHGLEQIALTLLAFAPLCCIAAFRDLSVGVDTMNYPYMIYNYSQIYSIQATLTRFVRDVEPLYILVVWCATRLSGSYNFVLFVSQLLIVCPIAFMLLKQYRRQIDCGVFLYATIMFGFTLNIMRQSIAFSLLLLLLVISDEFGSKRYYLKTAIVVLLAIGFHLTAVVGAAIYLTCRHFAEKANGCAFRETVRYVSLISVLAVVVFLIFGDWVLINILPLIKRSYSAQADYIGISKGKEFLICLMHGFAVAACLKRFALDQRKIRGDVICAANLRVSFLVIIVGVALGAGSLLTPEIYRLSFSLFEMTIPLYLSMLQLCDERDLRRLIAYIFISCLAFFLIVYALLGVAAILPFRYRFY